jgi:hypothetical protein
VVLLASFVQTCLFIGRANVFREPKYMHISMCGGGLFY